MSAPAIPRSSRRARADSATSRQSRRQVRRPLVVTDDPEMLDRLLHLAAAAGVEPEVAADIASARGAWTSASVVLVDARAVRPLTAATTSRRDDVLLVSDDSDDSELWQKAVTVGAEEVVLLPGEDSRVVDRLVEATDSTGGHAVVVGVMGGRGGAGASTLAASLAVTGVTRGLQTVLIDGDPLGGGIDMLLGGEDAAGLRWPDLTGAQGHLSGAALAEALPRMHDLLVLSWDRGDVLTVAPEAMQAVLAAAVRSSDLVIVDLPRRADAASELALSTADVALLVVPGEVRATTAAARVAAGASLLARDLRVVVRAPSASGLPADVVADALDLVLAGSFRTEPEVAAAAERGDPPLRRGRGSLASFCETFVADLALPTAA